MSEKNKRAKNKLEAAERARIEAAKKAEIARKKAEAARLAAERKEYRQKLKLERERIAEQKRTARNNRRAESLKRRTALYARIRKKLYNLPAGFDCGNYGFLPRVELDVDGDGTAIAARFSAANLAFSDMRIRGGKTRFKIRKKDLPKGIAILDEMCYNHCVSATYGIWRSCAYMAARVGLLLGAAVAVVGLYIAYGYVWRIDISGNENLSEAYIESALVGAGYKSGNKKSSVRAADVVAAPGGVEGVVDASCEVVGTTMYVRVLESEDYTVHGKCTAYTSEYDAKITRIVMRSGTASVKRGDVVRRGDTLASGDVYSTTGELLYTAECDADIYGEVAISFSADVSPVAVQYVPTGKTSSKTVFSLFGLTLGKANSPYESYEMRSHTARYDVLLPLYAVTYEFTETKATETERDVNEAAKIFAEQKQEEMKFVGEFESSYTVTPIAGGLYSVHVFLSGETLISRGVV